MQIQAPRLRRSIRNYIEPNGCTTIRPHEPDSRIWSVRSIVQMLEDVVGVFAVMRDRKI